MLTPDEAYEKLQTRGTRGMDEPTEVASPRRWYIDDEGVMCRAYWRDPSPARYPEFYDPSFKLPRVERE